MPNPPQIKVAPDTPVNIGPVQTGTYTIVEAQDPLIGDAAGHNLFVVKDPAGIVVSELDGLATGSSGTIHEIGRPWDTLTTYVTPGSYLWGNSEQQATVFSGSFQAVQAEWTAAQTCAAYMNANNINYSALQTFGYNSNATATTLAACMAVQQPTSVTNDSWLGSSLPGVGTILLTPGQVGQAQTSAGIVPSTLQASYLQQDPYLSASTNSPTTASETFTNPGSGPTLIYASYQVDGSATGSATVQNATGQTVGTASLMQSASGQDQFVLGGSGGYNIPDGSVISTNSGTSATLFGDNSTFTLASNPLTPVLGSGLAVNGNGTVANIGSNDAIIMTGTGGTVNASSFGNLITQTGGTLNFGANSYANKVFGDTNIASLTSGDYANFFGNGQTLNLNGDYVLGGASNSVFNIASGTNALIGGDGSIVNAAAGTNSLRFGGDQYLINANAVPIFLADSNTGRLNGTGLAVTTDNQNLTFGSTSANTTVFGSNNFAQTTAPFDFNSIIFDPSGTSNTSVWNGGALGSSVSQTSGFDPNTLNSYQLWSNPNAQGTLYEALSNNTFGGSTNIFTPAAFVDPTYGTETTNNTGQNFSGSVTTDNFLLGGMYAGQQMNFGYNYDPNSVFQGFNLNYNFGDGSSQVASFDPFGNWTAGATDLSAYGGYGLDGYNSGWNNSGSAATSPPGAAAAAAAASAKALATAIAAERSLSAASSSPSKTHAMIGAFHGHKAKLTNVVKRSKTHFSAKTHNAILAKAKALVAKAPPVSKFNAVGGGKGAQFAQEITTTQLKPHAAPITSPLAIAAHLAQAMATFDATTGSLDHVMLHTQDFRDRGTFASAHGMRMAAL